MKARLLEWHAHHFKRPRIALFRAGQQHLLHPRLAPQEREHPRRNAVLRHLAVIHALIASITFCTLCSARAGLLRQGGRQRALHILSSLLAIDMAPAVTRQFIPPGDDVGILRQHQIAQLRFGRWLVQAFNMAHRQWQYGHAIAGAPALRLRKTL